MPSYNKIILMGYLTRDPELKYTQNGSPVCSFGLAVNEKYTTKGGEKKEKVAFIDITVWGSQGENCSKYLSKGNLVLVEGKLKQDTWEQQDGQKRSKIGVTANSVTFMPKGSRQSREEEAPSYEEATQIINDMPF